MKEITKKRNSEIIEKYKQGSSEVVLSKEFKISKSAVIKILNQNGFYKYGKTEDRIKRNKKIYKKFMSVKSYEQLAKEFNVTQATVKMAIRANRKKYNNNGMFNIKEYAEHYFFNYNK